MEQRKVKVNMSRFSIPDSKFIFKVILVREEISSLLNLARMQNVPEPTAFFVSFSKYHRLKIMNKRNFLRKNEHL